MSITKFSNIFALLSLLILANSADATSLRCPPETLRSVIQNSDSRRGVSEEVFSEVLNSASTQAYLKEHAQLDSFPLTNFQYLSLLTPDELAGLNRPDLIARASKSTAKHKFGVILFNPLRELNNTYYHGHFEFSDAVNNHAKQRILEHITLELEANPDLKPYLRALYNDYKGVGFAFEEPKSPAVSARIDALLDRAVRNASFQFSAEYQQSDLAALTRGQRASIADPSRWISGGIGESHDQAAIAARYVRDFSTTGNSYHFRDIEPRVAQDLAQLRAHSIRLTEQLGRDSPLVDQRLPGLLSLKVFQILRAIKSSDVETAAGENLRGSLKFSFPTIEINDAQLVEIRRILTLPPGDRARARVSANLSSAEMVRAKLIVSNGDNGTYSISPEALAILQEEREFKHYFAAVNKIFTQRFGKPLSEPLVKDLRTIVNLVDRFSVPVLQEVRNPIAFEIGKAGFIAADFSGLGARNLHETLAALLRVDSPRAAVFDARHAFNLADRPLIQLRERFGDSIQRHTPLTVTPKAFSGDEMSVPLTSERFVPTRETKRKILKSLTENVPYSPSDVRLSFGLHFKEAQDLEKRLRSRLLAYPQLDAWLSKTAFGVDVITDAKGKSVLHLMPSRQIPRGEKALIEKEFLESFTQGDPFSPGKIIPAKESKPGASLRLDNGIPLRYPSSRPEQTRLEVA